MDLASTLMEREGSPLASKRLLESAAAQTGVEPNMGDRALVALALCMGGRRIEEVAASLDWREFESFSARVLGASGYRVRNNVVLRSPRAQIDLVATGLTYVLSVDCKHWRREHSPSALRDVAARQLKRSKLLRRVFPKARPIVSVILSFSASQGDFVEGVAVVPLRTLRNFLGSVESYSDLLRFT